MQELTEIAARGRAIAAYDVAAWHSTDAVGALKPGKDEIAGYAAHRMDDGKWTVVFGRLDEAKKGLLVVYEATQGATPAEFSAKKLDPPRLDTDYYYHAMLARLTAKAAFLKTNGGRQYNLTVLPAGTGGWYVYALPAQTDWKVLPYGGDLRYTVSADGASITETRQMHKTVLEESLEQPPSLGFHTHFLSDLPEDSDTFYAGLRKAKDGEFLVTPKFVYKITTGQEFKVLSTTIDFLAALENKKCDLIPSEADFCNKSDEGLRSHLSGVIHRLID